jgi:hypothetical protein
MTDSTQKQAFKQRVRQWAERLDVEIVRLTVRPMRRKWASCSSNGRLNFSDDLLGLDAELWDYVIVHELLHFSVPNHGRLWKSLMRAYLGDYESVALRLPEGPATAAIVTNQERCITSGNGMSHEPDAVLARMTSARGAAMWTIGWGRGC